MFIFLFGPKGRPY